MFIVVAILIPLLAAVLGVTVDLGRMYAAHSRAQRAADAALLGAVATASTTNVNTEFVRLFNANYPANYMGSTVKNLTVNQPSTGLYTTTISVNVPTVILKVFGPSASSLNVTAKVSSGFELAAPAGVEVALVLDNSGNMRTHQLKDAIKELGKILYKTKRKEQDNVRVHVIPYDVAINLGQDKPNWIRTTTPPGSSPPTTWLTLYRDYEVGNNYFISNRNADAPPDALEDVSDAAPTMPSTRFRVPYPKNSGSIEIVAGCVGSSNGGINYDIECIISGDQDDVAIGSTVSTQRGICSNQHVLSKPGNKIRLTGTGNFLDCQPYSVPQPIHWYFGGGSGGGGGSGDVLGDDRLAKMRFGINSRKDLEDAIKGMEKTQANRRINVGLMWGWFTLSPNWQGLWNSSLPGLPANNPMIRKHLVLVAAGKNNVYLGKQNTANDDVTTARLCQAIKARGITIYTVGFAKADQLNTPLLQQCASSPNYYFPAFNKRDLEDVFTAIGDLIVSDSTLRLVE